MNTLPNEASAGAWIQKSNSAPPFGGMMDLDLHTTGSQGVRDVWTYLVAQLGSFNRSS